MTLFKCCCGQQEREVTREPPQIIIESDQPDETTASAEGHSTEVDLAASSTTNYIKSAIKSNGTVTSTTVAHDAAVDNNTATTTTSNRKKTDKKVSLSAANLYEAKPSNTIPANDIETRNDLNSIARRREQISNSKSAFTDDDYDSLGSASDLDVSEGGETEWVDISKFGSIFSHKGASLYLRLGALIFGLGNVVYCALEILGTMTYSAGCPLQATYGWTYIPRLVFVVVQTFFLFKGSQIRAFRCEPLAWVALMHLMATNVCVWLRTLVNEIMYEFLHYVTTANNEHITTHFSHNLSLTTNQMHGGDGKRVQSQGTDYLTSMTVPSINTLHGARDKMYEDSTISLNGEHSSDCWVLLEFVSHYIFPFVLEYSLIAIGTFVCIVHTGFGRVKSKSDMARGFENLMKVFSLQLPEQKADSKFPKYDHSEDRSLAKSHVGVFLGIILLSLCIITIVFFYIYSSPTTAKTFFLAADIILESSLLNACVLAFWLMQDLAYVNKPITTDDILLLLAMVGSVFYEISVVIPSLDIIATKSYPLYEPLRLASAVLAAIESLVQSMFILSALRRYPSKLSHLTDMPGRGTLAFIVIANISIWILRTIIPKSIEMDTPTNYYGSVAWLLIMNINYPLLLFFRFHSSVCCADAWHVAYKPLHTNVLTSSSHAERCDVADDVISVAISRCDDDVSQQAASRDGSLSGSVRELPFTELSTETSRRSSMY